jgi:cytoskeletal protein CcmA (bactofilin family)
VTGNVTASEKVDIRDNGSVDGDLISPRVAIAEGAHFRGSVDMQRKAGQTAAAQPTKAPAIAQTPANVAAAPLPVAAGAPAQQRANA